MSPSQSRGIPPIVVALAAALAALVTAPAPALAAGGRSFKSGPIQVTADGSAVWVANPDHDSVSRLDTATMALVEHPLAAPSRLPRGLSVSEDGSQVWVACHDSDTVVVLDGRDGSQLARIDLPWGSGPVSVALSRDQRTALVACLRSGRLAVIDVASRAVTTTLDCFRSPFGIAFLEDGSAWVTHDHVYDRLTRVSRVDFSGPVPRVTTQERTDGSGPQDSAGLRDADPTRNVAEGGYLTFRGHLAQVPGGGRVWVPTQYGNRNQTLVTPDSIIQGVLRQIDLAARRVPNTIADKIILTATQVHDPVTSAWLGPGWNAPVAGPVDIAFSSDGSLVLVAFEQSENLLVMPASTPPERPTGAPPLPLVDVGLRPSGVCFAPVRIGGKDLAFVSNQLSRTISVVDVTTPSAPFEVQQVATTPLTPEPFSASFLNGEKLFHSSNDPRISANRKVACASCHLYGEQDGRAWELQYLPGSHGPRQTQSILGLSLSFGPKDLATGFGQLHRTGDRDEVQDFDHTFRGVQMGGTGFIASAQLQAPLGPPNAARDPDLDDLAAYVLSLPPLARSPHRMPDGSLSPAALRGARMFLGNGGRPADGACATCHVPETGYVDFTFHDVGAYRPGVAPNAENELGVGARGWNVNTASLIGIFDSAPYAGAMSQKEPESLVAELLDFRAAGRSAPHGNVAGLTQRQIEDLAEFLASIDGDLVATDIRALADTAPPHLVRVEPVSLTRIDAWFDESVGPGAANPSSWRVTDASGAAVPVTSATIGPHGDKVTLAVDALRKDCGPAAYTVAALGTITDIADSSTGGRANALDATDPRNAPSFVLGDTITITLGQGPDVNVLVPVHDAGTVYNFAAGANGSVWLRAVGNGANPNVDFLRFEWEAAFTQATGIVNPLDITDASVSLQPFWGDSQTVEARRVLQRWWDHGKGDQVQNPVNASNGHGGPTYRDSEWNVKAWNQPNAAARTAGVDGAAVGDYFGTNDTGFAPDAVIQMPSIQQRFVISGPGITDAYRFWLANPSVDYGHALNVPVGSKQESKFRGAEEELGQFGPVLTITYVVPTTGAPAPREVSPVAATQQLLVVEDPAGLRLSFEDLAAQAATYNLYEGSIGTWYSHSGVACSLVPALVGLRREVAYAPPAGNRYYLVTAASPCAEGPSGADSFSVAHPPLRLDCAP